jgi:hypothetical protein
MTVDGRGIDGIIRSPRSHHSATRLQGVLGDHPPYPDRREFLSLIGSAGLSVWPLAARGLHWGQALAPGHKTARLLPIKESRLCVKFTALDLAEGVTELIGLEQKRLKAARREYPFCQQPEGEEIATLADKLELTRNVVRRLRVIAGFSERAKAEAMRLGLNNSLSALYAAAKEPDSDGQVERLHLVAKRRSSL